MKNIWAKGTVGIVKSTKKLKKIGLNISEAHHAHIRSSQLTSHVLTEDEAELEENHKGNTCMEQMKDISNELAEKTNMNQCENVGELDNDEKLTYVLEQAALLVFENSVDRMIQVSTIDNEQSRLQNVPGEHVEAVGNIRAEEQDGNIVQFSLVSHENQQESSELQKPPSV
ncbi:hypothetical protein BDQ17DRAFT_1332353 [Cyathus striatus]|nr:hypothetical protein BDQ17DRAFT_1332353 [Cyathus striatus]